MNHSPGLLPPWPGAGAGSAPADTRGPASLVLRAQPDWLQAAQWLVDGCVHLSRPDDRVQLLSGLCESLGPALYPALLGVLSVVGDRGSPAARQAVAGTLLDGLRSGQVPAGRMAAWGARGSPEARSMRTLGPVEYLCAWHAQPGERPPLPAAEFDRHLRALLTLLSTDDQARRLYCDRLHAVADDPLDGALARATRTGLHELASTWREGGSDLHAPVDAFMNATRGGNTLQGLRGLLAPALPPASLSTLPHPGGRPY
jgi:hypothetical protein